MTCPQCSGNWNSFFRPFRHWAHTNVLEHVFYILSGDLDFEYALMTAPSSASTSIGLAQRGPVLRSLGARGGLTTKVVALVDALGSLAHILFLPGQRYDSVEAQPMVEGIEIGVLIADKGFDTDVLGSEPDACGPPSLSHPKPQAAHHSRNSSPAGRT